MKPQLLYFASDYQVGLTQSLSEQLIELAKESSIDLYSVSSENEMESGLHEKVKNAGIDMTIIQHLDEHKHFLNLARHIDEVINKDRITHVNVHNNWQLALVSWLKYRHIIPRRFKIIYTIHGYRHNSPLKAIVAIGVIGLALLLFANRVISMSSYVSRRFWFIRYKTDIVFYIMNKPEFMKAENHLEGSPLKMVFPAQFRHGKRQEILIDAVQQYIHETGDHMIKMYLPGDGPLLNLMKTKVSKAGLEDNIFFPGKLNHKDVVALYESSNIALVSSNVETYGRCIAEPFVLGRCLLTQKTGVAIDIVQDGKNGYFFTDSKSLASILKHLHDNPNKVIEIGQQAFKERILFSRGNVIDSYLQVLAHS